MVDDPVHDMIYDAITKPYHDPEFATDKMLPRKVTQYIPARDSKQTILDFSWLSNKNEMSWEMVFNPLQLSLKGDNLPHTTFLYKYQIKMSIVYHYRLYLHSLSVSSMLIDYNAQ